MTIPFSFIANTPITVVEEYPLSNGIRGNVEHPMEYTDPKILNNPDADLPTCDDCNFNTQDGLIDRRLFSSVSGKQLIYDVSTVHKRPINPFGKTGFTGRGLLYRWGPNHCADPIVTRFQRNEHGDIVYAKQGSRMLAVIEAALIKRAPDQPGGGDWAIPGGYQDPNDPTISVTAKREFGEEALGGCLESVERENALRQLGDGKLLYKGYSDDVRNTDNAWNVTSVFLFHDQHGNGLAKVPLSAGDEVSQVAWKQISHGATKEMNLFAMHAYFLTLACICIEKEDPFSIVTCNMLFA